tara:strand:- start:459 stop:731 length:273 start_codon:yes stop_codon:yes gene_type:complete
MEGACVFIDKNNLSNIVCYKEIYNKQIFFVNYTKFSMHYSIISMFDYYKIIPNNNVHILYNLPLLNSINDTLDLWKNMVLNKLVILNKIS